VSHRTAALTRRQIEDRLFRRLDGPTPHVKVDRVDWRSKRHPGSIRATVFHTYTGEPLEPLAETLRNMFDDIIEVEIIRDHPTLRPQVVVWFEAP